MAVQSVEEFFAILEKSKLVSAGGLEKIRAATTEVADAKALATFLVQKGVLTRFQAMQLLAGRHALQLGPFRLLDRIASSGTGAIYAAQSVQTKDQVAIKILPRKLLEDKEVFGQLKQQLAKLKKLDDPHICRLLELRREQDQTIVVLEAVDGASLVRLVEKEGPLPFDGAGRMVREAARALAAAHQAGLVHGDLSPEQMICDEQQQLKILDLGMAALNPAGASADYAAPELSAEAPATPAADVYSLGCTLYFLLAGKPPFPGGSAQEKRQKHREELPASVLELRSDTPPELMKLCIRMMAKNPDQRPDLAADVVASINEWLASEAEPAGDTAADEGEATEAAEGEPTDPDADRALAEAMAASDFDEHLDEPGAEEEAPSKNAASEPAEADDVLAEAMAASEFDHAIEDDEQVEKQKARLREVTGGTEEAMDELDVQEETEDTSAESGADDDQAKAAGGGPKLFGLDIHRLLGVKEDDDPRTKKKKVITAGVALGVIVVGVIVMAVVYLPGLLGFGGDGGGRGGGGGSVAQGNPQTPPTNGQPTDGTGTPTDQGGDGTETPAPTDGQPTDGTDPGTEPPGDGTETPPADGTETPPGDGTETPPGDGTETPPGDGTETPPGDAAGTEPSEPVSPFASLVASIDLPPEGSDLTTLGPVDLPPEAECSAELLGVTGPKVGDDVFSLKDAGVSDVGRTWIVQMSAAGADPVSIGRFVVKERELAYQWAPGMDAVEGPGALRQLALKMRSGDDVHVLALRAPFAPDAIVADFDSSSMRALVDIEWSGDVELLFVEITDLEGAFPPYAFRDDRQAIKAADDSTWLMMGEADDRTLAMKVESKLTPKLSLVLTPYFKVESEEKMLPFSSRNALRVANAVKVSKTETEEALRTAKGIKPRDKIQEEKLKARIAELEAQLAGLDRAAAQLTKLNAFYQEVNTKGKIHFRLFYRIGDHEIDLLRTEEPAGGEE